jgi:hypothetical protein
LDRSKIASARVIYPKIEKLVKLCGLKSKHYKVWYDEFGFKIDLVTKRVTLNKYRYPITDIFFKADLKTVIEESYWGMFTTSYVLLIGNNGRLRLFDLEGRPILGPLKLGLKKLTRIIKLYVEEGPLHGKIGSDEFVCGELPFELPSWVDERITKIVKG